MGLHELLIARVLSQDHQEKEAEDEVTKELEDQCERCTIEDKGKNPIRRH